MKSNGKKLQDFSGQTPSIKGGLRSHLFIYHEFIGLKLSFLFCILRKKLCKEEYILTVTLATTS